MYYYFNIDIDVSYVYHYSYFIFNAMVWIDTLIADSKVNKKIWFYFVSIDEENETSYTKNFFATPLQGQAYQDYLKAFLV